MVALQVIKYENVIHKFDTYFNYRATQVTLCLFGDFPFSSPVYITGSFGSKTDGRRKGNEILISKKGMPCGAVEKKSFSL